MNFIIQIFLKIMQCKKNGESMEKSQKILRSLSYLHGVKVWIASEHFIYKQQKMHCNDCNHCLSEYNNPQYYHFVFPLVGSWHKMAAIFQHLFNSWYFIPLFWFFLCVSLCVCHGLIEARPYRISTICTV